MNRTRCFAARIVSAVAAIVLTTFCASAAEQERPVRERYFNAVIVPGIDRLQEDALAAVRAAEPKRLGNALLMLILARSELASARALPAIPEERRAFLGNIAASLGLATEDELRRFRDFLAWSKKQSAEQRRWIPQTHAALLRFERHIADADPAGTWLPRWVDSIPLLPPAGTDAGAVPPAWTWRGHAVAQELAGAAGADAGWRARILAEYRKNALAAWRSAAAGLWAGIPTAIPDADIAVRLRRIAEGGDPASRFAAQAAEHLLPMFDAVDAGSADSAGAPPEILWLRNRLRESAEKTPADKGEDSESIAEATRRATDRSAALNAAAGAKVWPTLSPLAVDTYARHLLARRDALELDAVWRRTVYTPARFSPDDPEQRRARLVAFLTGPADGFWTWSGGGAGNNDNAAVGGTLLHSLPFSFSREFLAYCNAVLAEAGSPAMAEIPLTFAVESVTVAGGRIMERPTAVHFRLGGERDGQTLGYNNYPAAADWTWTPDITEAEIRITFPSHTAALRFTTPAELKKFALLFGEGRGILAPEDFGPDSAPVLRRLGVEEITIAATLGNLETLLPRLARPPLPPLPMSIIPKRGEQKAF